MLYFIACHCNRSGQYQPECDSDWYSLVWHSESVTCQSRSLSTYSWPLDMSGHTNRDHHECHRAPKWPIVPPSRPWQTSSCIFSQALALCLGQKLELGVSIWLPGSAQLWCYFTQLTWHSWLTQMLVVDTLLPPETLRSFVPSRSWPRWRSPYPEGQMSLLWWPPIIETLRMANFE